MHVYSPPSAGPAHMHAATRANASNRPPPGLAWSGAVSSGSSRHNNTVSRLAAIASLAQRSKQRPVSVSHADAGPVCSHDSHLCKRGKCCLFTHNRTLWSRFLRSEHMKRSQTKTQVTRRCSVTHTNVQFAGLPCELNGVKRRLM